MKLSWLGWLRAIGAGIGMPHPADRWPLALMVLDEGASSVHFTPNDYVTVVLTGAGADTLNAEGRRFNAQFPSFARWRTDWRMGEQYRGQFWSVCDDFRDHWAAGAAMPFSDMRLEPEGDVARQRPTP